MTLPNRKNDALELSIDSTRLELYALSLLSWWKDLGPGTRYNVNSSSHHNGIPLDGVGRINIRLSSSIICQNRAVGCNITSIESPSLGTVFVVNRLNLIVEDSGTVDSLCLDDVAVISCNDASYYSFYPHDRLQTPPSVYSSVIVNVK